MYVGLNSTPVRFFTDQMKQNLIPIKTLRQLIVQGRVAEQSKAPDSRVAR